MNLVIRYSREMPHEAHPKAGAAVVQRQRFHVQPNAGLFHGLNVILALLSDATGSPPPRIVTPPPFCLDESVNSLPVLFRLLSVCFIPVLHAWHARTSGAVFQPGMLTRMVGDKRARPPYEYDFFAADRRCTRRRSFWLNT